MTIVETLDVCKHCGESGEEHHVFEPLTRPVGCVCDPTGWRDPENIQPACAAFVASKYGDCSACNHDVPCHAQTRAP